jgi:hypothetical protein
MKTEFSTDKIWKVGRVVIKSKKSGWQRIQFILDKNGKATVSTADHDGTKFTREENMENCVLAVFAAIATKTPLSIFDNLTGRGTHNASAPSIVHLMDLNAIVLWRL